MTVPDFVRQWTAQAEHDLQAARDNRVLDYYDVCIVLCEQSAEKYLKALWAHQQAATPPRTHDLPQLAHSVGAPQNIIAAGAGLSAEYLRSRYPDVAGVTPFTQYTGEMADQQIRLAEEVQQWVLSQLPSSPP